MAMLQGVLERGVEWQYIQTNPARSVKRPRATRRRTVHAVPPTTVETLRRGAPSLRDATLISVLAYGGLRPGEALALRWADISGRTIRVDKALSLGVEKDTKNSKHRTVTMLKPLAQDLAEWRIASGRPMKSELVFPTSSGDVWSEMMYRNWRRRIYQPIAIEAGLTSPRPYDLRHSLASLLFAEGRNPAEIAEQMGHALETLLSTYVHIIEDLRGTDREAAETLISRVRQSSDVHILVTYATQDAKA